MAIALYAVQYTLVAFFIHSTLCLLIPYLYLVLPPFPLFTVNCLFTFYVCESVSILLYKFICYIF